MLSFRIKNAKWNKDTTGCVDITVIEDETTGVFRPNTVRARTALNQPILLPRTTSRSGFFQT